VFDCSTIRQHRGYPAESAAKWVLRPPGLESGPETNRVVYGRSIGSAVSAVGPGTPEAGDCYVVSVYIDGGYGLQHAVTGVKIDNDGRARELSDWEFRFLWSGLTRQ
jgi:hypothetical protein